MTYIQNAVLFLIPHPPFTSTQHEVRGALNREGRGVITKIKLPQMALLDRQRGGEGDGGGGGGGAFNGSFMA